MNTKVQPAPEETVYLVDGSGYIFRAYYAVAQLSTRDGFPTNALFGFTRMLIKLLGQFDSQHVVMVFDAGRETFRNEIYPEYKANRDECPEDLARQMPFFRDISQALGLAILELPGYEADDIIGTLANRLQKAGVETVIVSADKDLMQLIGQHVTMWDTMRDRRFGPPEVQKKFGVGPDKVVEFLALAGDSSDNIPGLRGVGPKTATQLIEKFGSVEKILASAESIRADSSIRNRKKISEQIELHGEIVRLSRRLVEVCLDAPVVISPPSGENTVLETNCSQPMLVSDLNDNELLAALERGGPLRSELEELIKKFEFSSLFRDFDFSAPSSESGVQGDYTAIFKANYPGWRDQFLNQKDFSFDLETTALDVHAAIVVGIAICWSDNEAFYIPFAHNDLPAGQEQVSFEEFRADCGAHLSGRDSKLCGQNLKYDIGVLAENGVQVDRVNFDTMVAAYLISPERGSYNLTALSQDYLGTTPIEYSDVVPAGEDFRSVPVNEAVQYACEDAHLAWLLKERLTLLLKDKDLLRVFEEIEVPLIPVLSALERRGVRLDTTLLGRMSAELEVRLDELRGEVYALAGREFNLNSPKQLSQILFEDLGIPTRGIKKTKTGFSTNSAVLEQLRHDYPLPDLLLEYRMLHKLKTTYVDALPSQISAVTGRLHSRFNQTVTATGRLSSSEPNLQNIPVMTSAGRRVRKAFVADAGELLLSADYSQVELRLLAHMSEDARLIEAFANDEDIHASTAREILGIPDGDEIDAEARRVGKVINFGIIYGMSGFRLARDLGIPVGVASEYIDNYFERFPGVRNYFDALEQDSQKLGFVETIFGRKRFLSDIESSGRDRGFARRAAMNAPIQGSAADLIKLAMIRIYRRIITEALPLRMIMQIHDELVFECPAGVADEMKTVIVNEMEGVAELLVPLKVDCGLGSNWEEAH